MHPDSRDLLQDRTNIFLRRLTGGCAVLALAATAAMAHPPNVAKAVNAQQSAATQDLRLAVEDLTISLMGANTRLAAAAPGERGQRLAELVSTARNRYDAMVALVDLDPGAALRVTLPANLRTNLPGEAAPFIEQDAQEEGELVVYHVDDVNPALDHYLYVLDTAGHGKLSLYFAAKPPNELTGTHVQVRGVKIDSALLAASGDNVKVTKAAHGTSPPPATTLGAQKTLTILVNFTDDTTQPFTVASAQSMMFTTVSNYWSEASYQQTTLTGDVAGWFTIPMSTTTCDYTSIGTYAKQAASKAGFTLSNYTRFLYAFPGSSCTWWGLSYVGGNPSESWVAAKYGFNLVVIGHELGHALGLYHSHSLDCGSASIASSGCTAGEYGDQFDVMGGALGAGPHYNAFQKEQLGWLNAGVSPPTTTASGQTGSVNYGIAPMELPRDATPRALKIPRAAACGSAPDYFYVESRQAVGFDSFISGNSNVLTGVLLHDATPGNPNSSYLLDMTPATLAWTDPALDAGIAFTDPESGFTVTPLSVGTSATTINVNFPPTSCTHGVPTIVLTPTGTEYTGAGATASYSVTITNNDACNCAASTFDISAAVPIGWSATNPRTGSIAPGASGSAPLSITTASSAAAAFYTILSTVANTVAPSFAGSTNATVAVITSLSVSSSSNSASYTRPTKRNQTLYASITTNVTSSGTPVVGVTVNVQVKNPSGAATTLSGMTASDGNAYVYYPIKSMSVAGTYTATSTATVNTMSNSATTTFAVQ